MLKMINLTFYLMMIVMFLSIMISLITKKTKPEMNKSSPFECGFSPLSSPRKSFSIQFFFIALIFLIFDIEISIIIPMILMKYVSMKQWMLTSILILFILILGLLNEWNQGMLEWKQ
uniref:NADH-ubiquinone oxidoreductase chain 3 n=1 Tax=Metanigrus guttatus TaxID=3038047 RepID=A0AB38XYG0_9HEMI